MDGGILLRNVPLPGLAEHFCTKRFGNLIRAIGHVVVENDNDLAGPAGYTFQRTPDTTRFVTGNDTDGDG